MLILLPKEGTNVDPLSSLSADKLTEYKAQMRETKFGTIAIPKFEFETKDRMEKKLMELGMPTAFTGSADFSGMDGKRDLFISFVIHQAYVKVDEEGTEAAAATAVGIRKFSAAPSQLSFIADHPFIFIIQDKETGNILFMGRVMDPSK